MTVNSKLNPKSITCFEYAHPWQASCTVSAAEVLVQTFFSSFRTNSAVYLLSLLMRGKLPSAHDLRRTVFAIFQSSVFIMTSAFGYFGLQCLIRKYTGGVNFYTASFVPAFLSSICAIFLERSSRHGLLCLYVTNGATETLYNMLVARGLIPRPIENAQVAIFGISVAVLLYYYRRGLHQRHNDSIFSIIRFAVGAGEQKIAGITGQNPTEVIADDNEQSSPQAIQPRGSLRRFPFLLKAVRTYAAIIQRIKTKFRHPTCPHHSTCIYYALESGVKLFSVGLGIQVALKTLPQVTRIFTKGPGHLIQQLFSRDTVKMAIFLGGFSSLYRVCACSLRHTTGRDDPLFAIPSALVASLAFFSYPDINIALYAMWKMLQITYNFGVDRGYVPKVPYFTILLYSTSTAILFHAAIVEPLALRPNYWKFLHSVTGGRTSAINREFLNQFGLESSKQLIETLRRTKTTQQITFYNL